MTRQIRLSDILIPKFLPLVNDREHMHQILTSGRAGTKSSAVSILVDYLIVSEPNTAAVVMRKHHNKLRKTVYKECIRALGRLGLSKKLFKITRSPMQITYIPNGNTIYFTGSDSIDDTKGMIDDNSPIKLVVLDELTEFFDKGDGEDEINNIVATFVRGNDEQFRMIYLYNPPKNPKAPVNLWTSKMEQRTDCTHIHVDYRDVPIQWLGKRLIAEAEAMRQADLKMYRWIWLGEAVGLDDLIYYMFDESKHITDPKHIKYPLYAIGVDYGQMNPTVFEAFGVSFSKKKVIGLQEYYHSGRNTGHQKAPSDYAKDFRGFVDRLYQEYGKAPVYVYYDPSARGLAEEIKRVCPEIQLRKANNDVKLGITRVQKLLNFSALLFCPEQKYLQEEMYLYGYDVDSIAKGDEKPIKENDHCMDAMRYMCMGVWNHMRKLLPALNAGEKGEEYQ